MKKILSIFSVLLLAGSLLAADVTVTESFSKVANFTLVTVATTLDGDLTPWNIRYGRKNGDAVGGTSETGVWLQGQSKYGYLEMNTALEGGIKRIAFNWGHGNEKDYTVVLRMFLRGTSGWESTPDTVFTHVATAKTAYVDSVVYDLQCKKNMRIKFDNKSVKTSDGSQPTESKGRPVIGKITITPYLMYGTKEMTVSLLNGSFTNNTLIDQTDEADPVFTYSSNNTSVATVNANTGEVTPVATGDATITAKWGDVKVTYVVHVIDNIQVENFSATGIVTKSVTTETTWEGDVCDWKVLGVRRAINDTIRISPRKQGIWSANAAYMETVDTIEGGIKHVTFSWKQWGSESGHTLKTTVTAGTKVESQEVAGGTVATATYNTFDKEMEVKDGVKLKIANTSYKAGESIASGKGRYVIENIQITPYLLYTKKSATAKITTGTYTNDALINNTGATPTYSSSNESVATVEDGVVTLKSVGTTTITAKWEEVYTSYELEVLDNVTIVTFDANEGDGTFTEPISYGAALPEIELPTRANYAFNAYFLTKDGKNRFTVTNPEGETKFLANLTVDSVTYYTDANRKWTYQGDNLTLYAQWKKKRTITLYNQDATSAGTQAVKIAYCANNESEKLDSIVCPTKTGNKFLGYFTEENGGGQQLIDKDGKFLANVEGFTNGKSQWILNKDTFLYANWETKKCTITLKCNYTDGPADIVFEATYGEASPLTTADVHTRENYTMYRGYWMDPVTEGKGTRLVNPTGKFTTDVTGYTTGQVWTRDAEEDITLYAHWELSTLEINEEADNADLLNQYDGKTMDVKLTRSNLVPNVWNSLCLPFEIEKTDLGQDVKVLALTGASVEDDVIKVEFADFNSNTLVAGTPYLVKPTAAVELSNFTDKVIKANPDTIGDNGLIELVGIYSPMALTANDKTKLFLGMPDKDNNNLFFASTNGSLKGMRAYFNLLEQTSGAPIRLGRMVIQESQTPTYIMQNAQCTMQGVQKMIIDGQLIIIRDGKQYNAQGALIK